MMVIVIAHHPASSIKLSYIYILMIYCTCIARRGTPNMMIKLRILYIGVLFGCLSVRSALKAASK